MQGDNHPKKRELVEAREQTIERLVGSFSRDELGLEAFEERVNNVYERTTPEELDALVADLNEPASTLPIRVRVEAVASASSTAIVAATSPPKKFLGRAILGNVERRGAFAVPQGALASAVLGNLLLDFRNVKLPPGVTQIHVRSILGNVDIIVPADLAVECDGVGILGNVENLTRTPALQGPEHPVLQIIGSAVLGNISLHSKLPAALQAEVDRLRESKG